jgi:hypothetical protein
MRLSKKTYIVFLISVIVFLILVFLFKARNGLQEIGENKLCYGFGIWFKIWIYYTSLIFFIPLIVFISCATILLIHKIFNSK